MGRFPTVCFYQKPAISRLAAFGEMQNAAERQNSVESGYSHS